MEPWGLTLETGHSYAVRGRQGLPWASVGRAREELQRLPPDSLPSRMKSEPITEIKLESSNVQKLNNMLLNKQWIK